MKANEIIVYVGVLCIFTLGLYGLVIGDNFIMAMGTFFLPLLLILLGVLGA